MKIFALIGSPRKGSNTDTLVEEVFRGAERGGHTCEKVYLYDYDISPCIDCRKCKEGAFVCVVKDGMGEIYPKLDEADLIIFGTPNYWYGPSAKMKLLIDRLRPYVASGKMKGKKAAVVAPAAEGPEASGPMMEMFHMSFNYLDVDLAGAVLSEAYERSEVKEKKEELKKAFDFGSSL